MIPPVPRPVYLATNRPIRPRRPLKGVQATLGRRIRSLRVAKGLSQEAMEARGFNYKYYQRIEAGRCNLTLRTLQRLASALDVEVEDLFRFSLGTPQSLQGAEEVVGLVTAMIGDRDEAALKKLRTFIREILERSPERRRR